MPLAAGTRLGQYEIVAPLGKGGMGEVYRAKDTKLKREVALKVLPDAFADDADRMARFQREAEVLASLNDPNIAAIYGIEERAIVMELVEGETLHGRLPLDTTLNYARQIANALEAAHERGITHRDLKPANIIITPDGVVKLLDFGLAKIAEPVSAPGNPMSSPTLTMRGTEAGMILGTAAYMAPEQARGQAVDKRADIWAFGVVFWEMLTGKRMFAGASISDVLSAVLTQEADLKAAPRHVRRLLQGCLEKDPKRRLRDIGDVWRLLEDSREPTRPRRGRWMAAIPLLALAIPAAWILKPKPESTLLQMQITAPEGSEFGPVGHAQVSLSPDGRRIVFPAKGKDGKRMLWTRLLAASDPATLPGTEDAALPFWSPDSRSVGFFVNGTLQKVDVTGGPPQIICPVNNPSTGTWNIGGVILFSENLKPIQRVDASGGPPAPVLALDAARAETQQLAPYFLPDGQHFLYVSFGKETGVAMGSLDGKTQRFLFSPTSSPASYAPNPAGGGWLMYILTGQLLVRPFHAGKGEFTGEAVVLTDSLPAGPSWSASENGLLAFRRFHGSESQLTWFGRDGARLGMAGDPGYLSSPRISPDQKTILFSRRNGQSSDLWLLDIARKTTTRITLEPGFNNDPLWSPDGDRIFYLSSRQNGAVVERPANGIGPETIFKSLNNYEASPSGASRDGNWLVVTETIGGNTSIELLSRVGGKSVQFLGPGQAARAQASPSPDGKWMLYSSLQAGRSEVFVQSLPKQAGGSPEAVGQFQISTGGGTAPVWRRDGREIFYVASDGKMMAVPVESVANSFLPGAPKPLFQTSLTNLGRREYDVTNDGQRFLINQRTTENGDTPITVIVNWPKLLQK